jgi:hypothetical protein
MYNTTGSLEYDKGTISWRQLVSDPVDFLCDALQPACGQLIRELLFDVRFKRARAGMFSQLRNTCVSMAGDAYSKVMCSSRYKLALNLLGIHV